MFVYKVKDQNSLLSQITVNGQYLTVWQRGHEGYPIQCSLFLQNNKDLLVLVKWGHDPRHGLFHDDLKLNQPHMHYILKQPINENSFNLFLTRLEEANTLEARKKSKQEAFDSLEADRIKANHEKFPPHIQKAIDEYDDTTPYIQPKEFDNIKLKFSQYTKKIKSESDFLTTELDMLKTISCELYYRIKDRAQYAQEFDKLSLLYKNVLKVSKSHTLFLPSRVSTAKSTIDEFIKEQYNFIDIAEQALQSTECPDEAIYPIPSIKQCLENCKNKLSEKDAMLNRGGMRLSANAIFSALSFVVAKTLRFGLITTGGVGVSTWLATEYVSIQRELLKVNSYHLVKEHQSNLSLDERNSFQAGVDSASSYFSQAHSLLNLNAWKNYKHFYAGMVAQQVGDDALISQQAQQTEAKSKLLRTITS